MDQRIHRIRKDQIGSLRRCRIAALSDPKRGDSDGVEFSGCG
jgi:hypothetical protein